MTDKEIIEDLLQTNENLESQLLERTEDLIEVQRIAVEVQQELIGFYKRLLISKADAGSVGSRSDMN